MGEDIKEGSYIDQILLRGSYKNKIPIEFHVDTRGMSPEEFTLSRKSTFGASDTSHILGVQWKQGESIDTLRKQKLNKTITDEEKKIGELPVVRKGSDLEGFILKKLTPDFLSAMDIGEADYRSIDKPEFTYRFKEHPYMSVNFDAVALKVKDDYKLKAEEDIEEQIKYIPIEIKLTGTGERYYNKERTLDQMKNIEVTRQDSDITIHIKTMALKYGIPAYYYTQVQRQIAALDAEYGLLGVWFDNSWSGKVYYIKRDDFVIAADKELSEANKDCLKGTDEFISDLF